MATKKHTYTFQYDGKTSSRTTHHVYTHAAILFMDYAPGRYKSPAARCEPWVSDVVFSHAYENALKAKKPWHSGVVVVALEQPE